MDAEAGADFDTQTQDPRYNGRTHSLPWQSLSNRELFVSRVRWGTSVCKLYPGHRRRQQNFKREREKETGKVLSPFLSLRCMTLLVGEARTRTPRRFLQEWSRWSDLT